MIDSGPERITVDMAWEIWTKKELTSSFLTFGEAAHIALKYPALGHYDFFIDFPFSVLFTAR